MERLVWLVNTTSKPIEECMQELKKWVTFHPNRPVQIPHAIATDIITKYGGRIVGTSEPDQYFADTPMKSLIIRDNGIGDLLLLEPVLRELSKTREVTLWTVNPYVFLNHPNIKRICKAQGKEDVPRLRADMFDAVEDLRNYSEQHKERHVKHRTDIFFGRFGINREDVPKEPNFYFTDDELKCPSILKRKSGREYVGVQLDASHSARRMANGGTLLKEMLLLLPKNTDLVVLGARQYVDTEGLGPRVIDLQGKTTVREMIRICLHLDKLVAVDSGIMHVGLTLHLPTVCLFSIISPPLRLKYYTGQMEVMQKKLPCIGCGDWHMDQCKCGDLQDPEFRPPCYNFTASELVEALGRLTPCPKRFEAVASLQTSVVTDDVEDRPKGPSTIPSRQEPAKIRAKLTMPIIVLNEEKNLPRFIENVIGHPAIGRVIVIDGGSTDKTVELLKKCPKVSDLYVHPYDKTYHDMQAMQRNYSCSFVRDGERILIMDIDECFSEELSAALPMLAECNIAFGEISRRTFAYYKDITDPAKQIKNYPDYQPRFFTWNRKFKWVGSPHHAVLNVPAGVKINKDIIHFEREGKDRDNLEKEWSEMQKKTRRIYG